MKVQVCAVCLPYKGKCYLVCGIYTASSHLRTPKVEMVAVRLFIMSLKIPVKLFKQTR